MDLDMDFGNKRAGGIDRAQFSFLSIGADFWGNSVGAKYHATARRCLNHLVNKNDATPFEIINDGLVMHDLFAHIDGCLETLQGQINDIDGAPDARAKTAG